MRSFLLRATLLTILAGHPAVVVAADAELVIKWKDLVPKTAQPVEAPDISSPHVNPGAAPAQDAKFMQQKIDQPGAGSAPNVISELDGKRVRIGGFIVPLDFTATNVKEFLLVPYVGACIHVPPPPANQIVYVKINSGFDVSATFDAVSVTGIMRASSTATNLAEAGYAIEAEAVTAFRP